MNVCLLYMYLYVCMCIIYNHFELSKCNVQGSGGKEKSACLILYLIDSEFRNLLFNDLKLSSF